METFARVNIPPRFESNDRIGHGLSSWVVRVDAVAKCYTNPRERDREIAVYERLGTHKAILQYYGHCDGCILLKFARRGTIRQYLESPRQLPTLATRLQWAEQITEGFSFIHSKGVLHCDISSNNIFLDTDLNALIGDFAGSSIDQGDPLGWYGASHSRPDADTPAVEHEIFALGSTFYEILTGKNPFEGWKATEVEDAIKNGAFPALDRLPALQNVISKCWRGGYRTVDDVLIEVQRNGITPSLPVESRQSIVERYVHTKPWPVIGITLAICLPLTWWIRSSGLRDKRWALRAVPNTLRRSKCDWVASLIISQRY